ncbi:MAG: hypothetical protein DMF86_13690 [Acidobacteria bacterium]|nr:MAG: hypothetical protein DMF86_13690 [Acidobacteriota bacterium]
MTAGPAPREPLWRAFERRPGRTFAAIAVLFAVAYGSSLVLLPKPDGRIVLGDAMHEYVQLRSFVFDRDLQFRNEYVRMYGLHSADEVPWVYEDTATGHVRNLMPIGPALLWTPAYLLVCAALWLFDALGGAYPLDGYGRLYQASAGFSGIAAAALGAWFSYRAAARVVEDRIAFWATLAVWLSSSAVYYSVVSPTYSHAASMFAVGVFWWAWVSTLPRQDTARYLAVGSLVGVAALMRWQDAVLLVVPATELCWRWRDGAAAFVARSAAVSAGAIAAFAPQAIVWTVLYGRPFAIPQGPDFRHLLRQPRAGDLDADCRAGARRVRAARTSCAAHRRCRCDVLRRILVRERMRGRLVGRRGLRRAPFRELRSGVRARLVRVVADRHRAGSDRAWTDGRVHRIHAAAAHPISNVHARPAAARALSARFLRSLARAVSCAVRRARMVAAPLTLALHRAFVLSTMSRPLWPG